MNSTKYLGFRFFLKILATGLIIGALGGWGLRWGLQRYNLVAMPDEFSQLFQLFLPAVGLIVGLFASLGTYLVAKRSIIKYVISLRKNLRDSLDVPASMDDNMNLTEQSDALLNMVNYELSELSETTELFEDLDARSKEAILEAQDEKFHDLDELMINFDESIENIDNQIADLKEFKSWFDETVKPFVENELQPLDLTAIDDFDTVVEFQATINQEIDQVSDSLDSLDNYLDRWDNGPDQLRSAITAANECISEMNEVYKEFPVDTLPEQSEDLRKKTHNWDSLADDIETGTENLRNQIREVQNSFSEMRMKAKPVEDPERIWESIKGQLDRADNKVGQLKQIADSSWTEKVDSRISSLLDELKDLKEIFSLFREKLKDKQQSMRKLNELAIDLGQLIEK